MNKIFAVLTILTLSISAHAQVLINEISYNPCAEQGSDGDCEFIELYNAGATAVDVSNWTIDDPTFAFPAGAMIAAGEYVLITEDGTFSNCIWQNAVPAGVQTFAWTGGNLGNSGESLTLSDAAGAAQNTFTYDDGACGADGDCASLQYSGTGDNSTCDTWTADVPSPGAGLTPTEPCEGGVVAGDPCDDGIATTVDDVIQIDCSCVGTTPDCPDLLLNFGDLCDDGDPATVNDMIQTDCTCSGIVPGGDCPGIFISEFAYDCDDADMNEIVEVAVPNTFTGNLADVLVDLYNGNGNGSYYQNNLGAFAVGTNDGTYTYYTLTGQSLQNGAPDGLALSYQGSVCEFLSYEGTMVGTDGPALGIESTDIGVTQSNATTCDITIQLFNGVWSNACATPGAPNTDLAACDVLCPDLMANPGDACDDGDPITVGDVVLEDCTCAGTPPDCPEINANIGSPCDDGDSMTVSDTVQDDCTCVGIIPGECPGAFISEFGYDCDNADANESIEISVPVSFMGNLADFQVLFYNGSNGTVYNTISLDIFTVGGGNTNNNFVYWNGSGTDIQNGGPDGFALVYQGTVCEFISYEGTMTATDGPAAGMSSLDVGVSQSNGTVCDQTIQFFNCQWGNACATLGEMNTNAQCVVTFDCPDLLVNFGDTCNDGDQFTIGDVIGTDCVCAGTPVEFDCPDLFANIGDMCDDGDANTENDTVQDDCTCVGVPFDCPDLMLNIGDPCDDGDPSTVLDMVQADCSCMGMPQGVECPGAMITEFGYDCAGSPDANEALEVVLPTDFAGNLADIVISLYNGSNGTVYASITLDQFTLALSNSSFDIYTYTGVSVQNGSPDGIALTYLGAVCQGISYEGDLIPTDGPAAGIPLTDIGIAQDNTTNCDETIQFVAGEWLNACATLGAFNTGDVECPETFDCPDLMANVGDACDDMNPDTVNDEIQDDCSCAGVEPECPVQMYNVGDACDDGNPNTTNDTVQSDCSCEGELMMVTCSGAFINEFAYNCTNDTNELIEVAVPNSYAGSLALLQIDLYTSAGTSYNFISLDNFTVGVDDGTFTYYYFDGASIQNAAPGGIALSFNGMNCEFYSYGGTITATDGGANGFTSIDLGFTQDATTMCDLAVQLVDCQWVEACTTPGNLNTNSLDCMEMFDCPDLMLNIGDSCDDGNPDTFNDIVTADCACVGLPSDCETGDIIITEIHYNPCSNQGSDGDYEFIELYNNGTTDISLNNWEFGDNNEVFGATDITFPDVTIPAGGYLVLAGDALTYDGVNGLVLGVNLVDGLPSLSNAGDDLVLYDCAGTLIDFVFYNDGSTADEFFPDCADGDNDFCATLSLPLGNYTTDNNEGNNWLVELDGGSPGLANNSVTCGGTAPCDISILSEIVSACDNNNTADPSDDTFTITVTATTSSGTYTVSDGVNTSAPTASGAAVVMGPYPSDGTTTIVLTYTSTTDAACTAISPAALGPVFSCSQSCERTFIQTFPANGNE